MIALDTNCLLRLLTNDLPDQARKVADLLEQCENSGSAAFIAVPVLVETIGNLAWRRYRFSREQIVAVINRLLNTQVLVIDQRDAVAAALKDFQLGWGDYADHLIRRLADLSGATPVVTFDAELLGHVGFAAP
jgi:predicted nucleic-acid-binding protein